MTVSAAKLEANRKNSTRSCGPALMPGRSRSKLNAVKHGMRAATLVLLDEDPEVLEEPQSGLGGQPDAPRRRRTADRG